MLITLENVTHIYQQDPAVVALDDVNLQIEEHNFIALIGSTGSGKSTMVQLFNGLIEPTKGKVIIDGKDINNDKKASLREIRRRIGLVFQYPEHQIFEETVYREIAFGPGNLALAKDEIEKRVKEALLLVGMDYEQFKDRSPFSLSGGQKRKIAIAGVLAMKPEVLILDEPFAGLDPEGRQQLSRLLTELHCQQRLTLILISHRMDEVASLTNRVIVLNRGKIELDGTPVEVFSRPEMLRKLALDLPQITEILYKLKEKGLAVNTTIFSLNEAVEEIYQKLRGKMSC